MASNASWSSGRVGGVDGGGVDGGGGDGGVDVGVDGGGGGFMVDDDDDDGIRSGVGGAGDGGFLLAHDGVDDREHDDLWEEASSQVRASGSKQ